MGKRTIHKLTRTKRWEPQKHLEKDTRDVRGNKCSSQRLNAFSVGRSGESLSAVSTGLSPKVQCPSAEALGYGRLLLRDITKQVIFSRSVSIKNNSANQNYASAFDAVLFQGN